MQSDEIAGIIAEVLKRLEGHDGARTALEEPPVAAKSSSDVTHSSVDSAVTAAGRDRATRVVVLR